MNWLFAQPLESIFSGPIGLILVIAAAVSASLAGIFWFTLGRTRAASLGYVGVPAGFLAGFALFLGLPHYLSADPLNVIFFVVLIGLIVGIVVDSLSNIDTVRLAVVLGWPAFVVVAIGWREMPDFATFAGLPMALLWLAAVLVYLWMGAEHKVRSAPIVVLLAVSIGLGFTAFLGDSKILTMLSVILALAFVGMLAWNWPVARTPVGVTAHLGAAGSVLAIAVAEVLYSNAAVYAVALLLLALPMAPLAARLPFGAGAKAGPIVLMILCALPVAAATAAAYYAKSSW